MNSKPKGLRRRLALALALLATSASVLMALVFWTSEEYIERTSLRQLLRQELKLLVKEAETPYREGDTYTLRLFRPAQPGSEPLPTSFAGLEPGLHTRIEADGRNYRVLVSDITPGDRVYLAYDLSLSEKRAYWLALMLLASTLMVIVAAWWMSGRIARRSLEPLNRLVQQISGLDLGRRGQRLTLGNSDPELEVIVAALNQHMSELDALIESEQAFSAAASHELRTPLGVIGGAAAVLAENVEVPKPVLARIERAVAQASLDLDALLALSRTREPTALTTERLDQLLTQIATFHLDKAETVGTRIHWEIPAPQTRLVSAGALSVIFSNLLRNALHAAPGGDVHIALKDDALSITDNGPGLPPEIWAQQGRPAALLVRCRDGGTGMGLYIAYALAQRYGWRLSLSAAPGGGTCAELRF